MRRTTGQFSAMMYKWKALQKKLKRKKRPSFTVWPCHLCPFKFMFNAVFSQKQPPRATKVLLHHWYVVWLTDLCGDQATPTSLFTAREIYAKNMLIKFSWDKWQQNKINLWLQWNEAKCNIVMCHEMILSRITVSAITTWQCQIPEPFAKMCSVIFHREHWLLTRTAYIFC